MRTISFLVDWLDSLRQPDHSKAAYGPQWTSTMTDPAEEVSCGRISFPLFSPCPEIRLIICILTLTLEKEQFAVTVDFLMKQIRRLRSAGVFADMWAKVCVAPINHSNTKQIVIEIFPRVLLEKQYTNCYSIYLQAAIRTGKVIPNLAGGEARRWKVVHLLVKDADIWSIGLFCLNS